MADEPVTAPDQHKPGYGKQARIGAVITMVLLLLMTLFGNHRGHVESLWVLGAAAAIGFMLVADWVMRKNGIRR